MSNMRLLIALFLILAFPVSAQVYKWTDAEGNVHFGTQPPPGEQQEVKIRESKTGPMVTDRQRRAMKLEDMQDELESANRRRSFSTSLDGEATKSAGSSRSCNYAKSVLQSYENKLDRLLLQGYKQYERQRAETKVAEWQDQVNIYCQ